MYNTVVYNIRGNKAYDQQVRTVVLSSPMQKVVLAMLHAGGGYLQQRLKTWRRLKRSQPRVDEGLVLQDDGALKVEEGAGKVHVLRRVGSKVLEVLGLDKRGGARDVGVGEQRYVWRHGCHKVIHIVKVRKWHDAVCANVVLDKLSTIETELG